ncbi:MAG: DoxX family protein [Methylobacterium sp.]|uniref:DoxX family protein n=1 Tax=Methylobacterium sp. TaxID=409 RepID=UPI0025E02ACE|nr:DoxX family protein [Methylobacterium sp.]MBX9932128.1 DoxX family protein [Methylobacterium sp.]
MRWSMIAVFGGIGILHVLSPDALLRIMPDWVPEPRRVVVATGWLEIAASLGLLFGRIAGLSGLVLALYAVAVFPANLKHAFQGIVVPGLPDTWWYHGPRLALQPVIVWWCLYATGWIRWPFGIGLSQQNHKNNNLE